MKASSDPLKTDPVAHVTNACVGCGLCGEVAHAASLCPSFWRAEIISNPNIWDRFKHRIRRTVIKALSPRASGKRALASNAATAPVLR